MTSGKKLAIVLVVLIVSSVGIAAVALVLLSPPPPKFSLKALIADQLAGELPDPAFAANVTANLQSAGFDVTYVNDTLDVEFFRGLAKGNYGVIVLRAHSALRLPDNQMVDLFTGETYNTVKYPDEQNNGLLVKGTLDLTGTVHEYFAITSKFIESLEGTFPKSIVVAMGCWGLKPGPEQTLADSFIKKGALAFTGWTDLVSYVHTDAETAEMLQAFLMNDETLGEAVDATATDVMFNSEMRLYGQGAGNLKLSELIAEAEIQSTSYSQSATLEGRRTVVQTGAGTALSPKGRWTRILPAVSAFSKP